MSSKILTHLIFTHRSLPWSHCGLVIRRLPRMQEIVGSNPTEAQICFSHYSLLKWNVKKCFEKLILNYKMYSYMYIIRHTQPKLYNQNQFSVYSNLCIPRVQSNMFNLYAVCMNLMCNVQSRQVCTVERCIYCIKKLYRLYSVQQISVQSREVCNVERCAI